jgi:hypothetical protein
MISRQTARQVKEVIKSWGKEVGVTPVQVLDLLSRLSEVPGNRSYEDSVKGLEELLRYDFMGPNDKGDV